MKSVSIIEKHSVAEVAHFLKTPCTTLIKLLYKTEYTRVFQEGMQAGGYAHPKW